MVIIKEIIIHGGRMRLYSDTTQCKKVILQNRYFYSFNILPFYLIAFFLLSIFFPSSAAAQTPTLIIPQESVTYNEPFDVRVGNISSESKIIWSYYYPVRCEEKGESTLSCVIPRQSEDFTIVIIGAVIEALGWEKLETVTAEKAGGRKQKTAGWTLENQKMKDIRSLLDRAKGGLDPIIFFREIGSRGLRVSDLIAFKSEFIKQMPDPIAGKNLWEVEYGSIEKNLMLARREGVKQCREAALRKYFQTHPETPYLLLMDVGAWVTESVEKMRFEGDIDFTFILFTMDEAIVLRDIFEAEIKAFFGMDMISVDSLATAQRAATRAVYIGAYGGDWAEIDAIKRGRIEKVTFDNGDLIITEASKADKYLTFAILKNNVQKKLTGQDKLAEAIREKQEPKPRYDMEPGISLEFLRHITMDGIEAKLAPHEKIMRMAKYLNRSAGDHKKFLEGVPGMTLTTADAQIVDAAAKIIALKQWDKDQLSKLFSERKDILDLLEKGMTPEQTLREILKVAGEVLGPAWAGDIEDSLVRFGRRAAEVIKNNIAEGIKARNIMINEAVKSGKLEEAENMRKQLLDDLVNEHDAFKHDVIEHPNTSLEFPKVALDAMNELKDYFLKKLPALPEAEQKKLRELLEKAADNPNSLKIFFLIARERISHYVKNPSHIIPALNNFLDTMDNVTLEKIRNGDVAEFEISGKKVVLKSVKSIADINKSLNESVLGKISQSQVFQGFNLGQEFKAYYDAVMRADTWNEAFVNFGSEVMVRRLPGYMVVDSATNIKDWSGFVRIGVELGYLLFPTAAIPEGLYGMFKTTSDWYVGKLKEWQHEDMLDAMLKGATFQKVKGKYQMTGIVYPCPSGGTLTLDTREAVLQLPKKCPGVYHIILPEIKNHPAILGLQEVLANEAVSSGPMGQFPYTYDTRGSKYGEQLYTLYRKKVDEVVIEYFKGVVEKLEIIKGWATGTNYAGLIGIERELECSEPLVSYSGVPWHKYIFRIPFTGDERDISSIERIMGRKDIKADAERFQAIVDNYSRLKKYNSSVVSNIRDKWDADCINIKESNFIDETDNEKRKYRWANDFIPQCEEISIKLAANTAQKTEDELKKAVKKAYDEVEKIVGKEKSDYKTISPAIKASICAAYYKERNTLIYENYKKEYEQALDEFRKLATELKIIDIDIAPETPCAGREVILAAVLDRECRECVATWDCVGSGSEQFKSADKNQATWLPKFYGTSTIRVRIKENSEAEEEITKEKKIMVLPPEKCPRLKLILEPKRTEVQEDEEPLIIEAKPVEPYDREEQIERYIWTENGIVQPGATQNTYAFSAKGKEGLKGEIKVRAKTNLGYTEIASCVIKVTKAARDLKVFILPAEKGTISADEAPVSFTADVVRKADSGRMRYQWSLFINGKEIAADERNSPTFQVKTKDFTENDEISIKLYVQDIDDKPESKTFKELLREGQAEKILRVGPSGEMKIVFGEIPASITDAEDLKICVESPVSKPGEPIDKFTYEWFEKDDKFWRPNQTTKCSSVSAAGKAGKSIILKVLVRDKSGRKAEAETSPVKVIPAEEKPKIEVSVKPESDTITQADTRDIICTANPLNDSGRLTFNGVQQSPGVTSITIKFSGKGHENLVPVACEVSDEKGRTGEAIARIFVKKKSEESKPEDKPSDKPITGDPKKQAEEKYQWLKDSLKYLEELKEADRKAFVSFRRTVIARMVSEFTSQFPPPTQAELNAQDLNDLIKYYEGQKASCGERANRWGGEVAECVKHYDDNIKNTRENLKNCGATIKEARSLFQKYYQELQAMGPSSMDIIGYKKGMVRVSADETVQGEVPVRRGDEAQGKMDCAYERINYFYRGYEHNIDGYLNDNDIRCLGEAGADNGKHQRELKKKIEMLPDTPPYKLYKEFVNLYDYQGYLASVEKVKQEFGLPDPIPSPIKIPWVYTSPCGGGGSGSSVITTGDQSKLTVTLKASPEKTVHDIGEIIKISASVTGGKAPYTYSWTGEHEGKDETVSFASRKPGDHKLSVDVKDASGKTGTAGITIQVGGVTATIEGLPKEMVFGTWAYPSVKLSGAVEPGAEYRVLWNTDPKINAYDGKTPLQGSLFFDRMGDNGKITIVAKVEKKVGDKVYREAGESDEREVTVKPPKFKWAFEPPKGQGKVGQEVKATITTEPAIKTELIDYEWSYPESSNRMPYADNESIIGFVPKDPKPMMLLVAPKVKGYREESVGGGLKEEYQAGAYTITVSKPRYLQSKPQLWKCDTQLGGGQKCGLVEVEYEFAVDFNILMRAEVSPKLDGVNYKWTITPQGCTPMNDITQDLTISCSQTGTYTATVTVRDKNDIVLGAGSGQVSITIDQKTLSDSKKKADEAKKNQEDKEGAQKKLNQALEALREGKIDEAIRLAEEAAKIDKKLAEPVLKQISQECKKLGWDKEIYERDFKKGIGLLEAAVRLNPADKEAEEKLTKARKFEKIWPQVEQKVKEYYNLIDDKKIFTAYKKMLEIQDLQHEMPGQMGNRISRDIMKAYDKANKEYNQFIQEASRKHTELFNAEEWDAVLSHALEVLKREHSVAEQKNWESNVALAKQRLGERAQAWNYYLSVKAVFDKGDIRQASEMLRDLKNKPQYFMKRDPRRQEIEDLIASIEKGQKVVAAKEYAMNLFRAAEQILRDYHYGQAAEILKDGLRAMHDNGDPSDPDYAKYYRLYEDCVAKDKRLKELLPGVQSAAIDEKPLPLETIQNALRNAEEMVSLQPSNTDSQIYKGRLESKLKNIQGSKLKGEELWNEGRSLFDENRPSDALGKFKESLKYLPTPEHTKYVQELEAKLSQNKEMAKKLRAEGEAFQNQNRLEEAVAKYRESLKYLPDPKLEEHIKLIETKLAEGKNKKQTADSLWKEGTGLYEQKRYTDALNKFKESLTSWSDQKRQEYVKQLEAVKAAAKKLRDEGEAFQNQGKLQDAVNKYKESVKTWPNPALEEHIIKVENEIRSIEDKKACAKKNRDEGAALQQQNRLSEALEKYRASYACRPTPEMQEHIKKVEAAISTAAKPNPNDIRYVKGFQGTWNSNWGTLEFKVDGIRVEGNYTHDKGIIKATLTGDKKTMEGQWLESPSYSPPSDGGKVTFTLSADGNTIRGKWGYGDNLNGGDWTGTRIKDATTPVIIPPEPPKPPEVPKQNLTGTWIAECSGTDKYEIRITHSNNNFTAVAVKEQTTYKGTISGSKINGLSVETGDMKSDTIDGDIISDNEIKIRITGYIGSSPYTNTCTLRRVGAKNNG